MTDFAAANFRALGTGCSVLVTDSALLDDVCCAVATQIAAVDVACSRFRDDSELMLLNGCGGRSVRVSDDLFAAIAISLRAARLTHGDLDPTIGPALHVLGYDRDFDAVSPDGPSVREVRCVARWQSVLIDQSHRSVQLPRGVTLDLGATAKAWAADRAATAGAAIAAARGREIGVLVNLGGDIATAGTAPPQGWLVHLADSHAASPEAANASVTIYDGAVATSSTTVRQWTRGHTALHHIIDPTTFTSAVPYWRTVTVAAATCVDANIATTTSIIRGVRAAKWLESLALPARLVRVDDAVLTLNGWPDPETDPAPDPAIDRDLMVTAGDRRTGRTP